MSDFIDFGDNRVKSSPAPADPADLVNLSALTNAQLDGVASPEVAEGTMIFVAEGGVWAFVDPPVTEAGPHPVLRYDYTLGTPYWDTDFNENCEAEA